VIQATATDELRVRFDPHAVAAQQLIRIAEVEILGQPSEVATSGQFGLENVMVGVAAVGEFVPAVSGASRVGPACPRQSRDV
jgi:hypothetical protein